MFNYLLVNPPPGFTFQSIYLCTEPTNSQSRDVKYLAKNIYAPFFRLLKSGFGKLYESDASLPQLLQKPPVLEMVLLRSCNLKDELQNGVQRSLSQESQLLICKVMDFYFLIKNNVIKNVILIQHWYHLKSKSVKEILIKMH